MICTMERKLDTLMERITSIVHQVIVIMLTRWMMRLMVGKADFLAQSGASSSEIRLRTTTLTSRLMIIADDTPLMDETDSDTLKRT